MHRSFSSSLVVLGLLATSACGGNSDNIGKMFGPGLKKIPEEPPEKLGIVTVGEVPKNVAAITGRTWKLIGRARKLKPKEPVKLAVLAPTDLVGVVKKHVATEIPPDLIKGEGRTYAALGLIPPDYDYEAETYSLLEEELAGLYIPEDKTMYVSKGIDDEDLEATLAHELVHALQDQYFSIGARMKFTPGASDSLGAMHALAEGDATSAMLDVMILRAGEELGEKNASMIPDRDPEDLIGNAGKKKASKLSQTPRFLAVGLLAPYADGMRFVNGMRRRGGWHAVDLAWQKPPTTTEQLLHLEKYDAQEPALVVPSATSNALGPTFKKTFDDVFGEQEGRIAFSEWLEIKSAKMAAAGWGGDRVTLFEDGKDKRAVAWQVVFDDYKEANEAHMLLSAGFVRTYGIPSQGALSDPLQIWGALPAAAPPPKVDKKDDKKDAKPKDPKTKDPKALPPLPAAPPLPQLPDAPGASTSKSASTYNSCRALKKSGSTVTIFGGVPCDVVVAWTAEVGK